MREKLLFTRGDWLQYIEGTGCNRGGTGCYRGGLVAMRGLLVIEGIGCNREGYALGDWLQ
jgi:hypothetical protein